MVESFLSIQSEDMVQQTITFRTLKGLDTEQLANLMNLQDLDEITNLNDLVSSFNSRSRTALDQMAPIMTKTITIRHKNPWFNDHIHKAKSSLRQREKIWRRYREDHQWTALKDEQNRYKTLLHKSKCGTIMGKVLECDKDTKKLCNLINNLTGIIKTNPVPNITSEETSAKKFADYFMRKIEGIRDELKDAQTFQPSQSPNLKSKLNEFKPTTQEEVCKIIQSMAPKSCESDALSTNTVK